MHPTLSTAEIWVSLNDVKMNEILPSEHGQRKVFTMDFEDGDVLGLTEGFDIMCVYSVTATLD